MPISDIISDRRASAPGDGNRSGLVHCGASNSRRQDDVVRESDAGAFSNRQQDDVVMAMDAGASTSRQYNDAVDEIEEETPRNADQGREEPERKDDIPEIDKWVASIETKRRGYTVPEAAKTDTISIPRVPRGRRGFGERAEEAYAPSVISIGPYHRGMPLLYNMEKRKWQCQCLKDIDRLRLKDLFEELKKVENQARSFYPESKEQLESGPFLEMLLLDGCFIVDYLSTASSDESNIKIWSDHQIRNDLLLLENQLPFFVLVRMYRLVTHDTELEEEMCRLVKGTTNKELEEALVRAKLVRIAVKVFHNIAPKQMGLPEPEKWNFKHLLHLYHAYLFFDEHIDWKQLSQSQVRTIPSAIFLEKAGIQFKMRPKLDKVIDVEFIKGVINMTPLVIDAFTISQFLNLIEFERADPEMEPRITGFLQFMDYIINTSEDVALLRKNGILEHAFGSDEELANIINRLTSGTFHQLPFELKEVYEEVDTYCKAKWNRWWATLWRDYFGSPWATIATLSAILLLSSTIIGTFFSAASYFRHEKV